MKPLQLTKEQQKESIEAIKSYYFNERDEEITELAASLLLDFIIKNIGPHIYNQAIKDSYSFMGEKIDELFALEKSPARK